LGVEFWSYTRGLFDAVTEGVKNGVGQEYHMLE
jgi:hypothetical protein